MDFYVLVDETHAIHEQKRLDISGLMNNGKELYQTKFNQKVPEGKIELIKLNEITL